MKILVSPSKTKKLTGVSKQSVFDAVKTQYLIKKIQGLSVAELGNLLKIKEDKAEFLHNFYAQFDQAEQGIAIESYTGLAFKNLAWSELSEKGKAFGAEHLVILSGLYGLVEPFSPITDYRLDLVDALLKDEKRTLYEYWQEAVNGYFASEDWLLNVASKEYSKLITHPKMVSVEFQEYRQGEWKQLSTSSKQMRGRLVHYILDKQIMSLANLPKVLECFKLETKIPNSIKESFSVIYRKK